MATRFYFSSSQVPELQPGFAAWSRTLDAVRRRMYPTKDGSTMSTVQCWSSSNPTANQTALAAQFHSEPLTIGTSFATTDTVKCQVRCQESAANDNINRAPICIKVYNGTTLQATLLALGHVGPNTTEWPTSLTNKRLADGDTLAVNYTTVAGDYLVLEIGGQVDATGGTTVTGTMSIGANSGTDLGENETDTSAFNPWLEFSNTFTIAPAVQEILTFARARSNASFY
jgi:hypothetical protein